MAKTALLLGGSGLVGGYCLEELLGEPTYARVVATGRRMLPRQHPKLEQTLIDFERLEEQRDLFQVDDVFCCLGTTIKKAGSREAFRRVDYTYPLMAARAALEEGAGQYLIVTAMGADPRSRIFYNRIKGETERDLCALPYEAIHIFRPSILLGERGEFRAAEEAGKVLMHALSPLMLGHTGKYRPIHAQDVARAMVKQAVGNMRGIQILESQTIQDRASR